MSYQHTHNISCKTKSDMSFFENQRISKLFSSFREKSTIRPTFSRKMFSSFREKSSAQQSFSRNRFSSFKGKSSSKPILRRLSFKVRSSSKNFRDSSPNLSGHQEWKINPLYVSVNQVNWLDDVDIYQQTDLVKQTSSSSGVSSGSSRVSIGSPGVDSYSSDYGASSSGSSFAIASPTSVVSSAQPQVDNSKFSSTPVIPTSSAQLRIVRRRISSSSKSDADFEIHIDEYYTQGNSELISESTSGIISDDETSQENYHHFCEDMVDDIRTLLHLERPEYKDCIHIGMLESSH